MKRFALLMTLALGFAGPVLALQQPAPGQRDARVRTVTYDPANVVRLNGVIRASTQIVFADDEEIAHVAIGDAIAWEVAPAGSILFLNAGQQSAGSQLRRCSGDLHRGVWKPGSRLIQTKVGGDR